MDGISRLRKLGIRGRRGGFPAHGVLFPAKRPASPAKRHTGPKDGRAARGFRPRAVRRSSPFPVRRHRFCLPRFPAGSGCFCFRPGVRFPGRFLRAVVQPFDRVQVSENRAIPNFRSGAALAALVVQSGTPSVRLVFASLPLGFSLVSGLAVRLVFASLPLGPAQLRTAFRRRRLRSRSTTRSRPPVPLVCCSFRSWFVSRSFVWFRLFSSAHFVSFVRSVHFRSFPVRFVCFVLSLILVFACSRTGLLLYFRVYYTLSRAKTKCIFCRKTCVF